MLTPLKVTLSGAKAELTLLGHYMNVISWFVPRGQSAPASLVASPSYVRTVRPAARAELLGAAQAFQYKTFLLSFLVALVFSQAKQVSLKMFLVLSFSYK